MPPKRTHAATVTFPPVQPPDRQTTRVRERELSGLAMFGNLARLPELVGKRRRLVSARNRRKLADGLRRTAAAEQPSRRFDCCPVLADRVAGARYELLLLADALEHSTDPDPASVELIRELLTNGCSPLYNANVPAQNLHATLTRAAHRSSPDRRPTQTQHDAPTDQPRATSKRNTHPQPNRSRLPKR